ncbi:uncharacterized protein LOC110691449 [Chenopodium quinoa]|uniref:uncharacterized protein LOC110691449 n=1 Tax=Chenopodium quinoa TaxID=63459 RepID=UPI000B78A1C1|nr:uncharacterized protein LOC110691449 [Chenopodium quinoa]
MSKNSTTTSTEMASILNFLSLLLLISFVHQGISNWDDCNYYKNVQLMQERTDEQPRGWKVSIINTCKDCVFFDVRLNCTGFVPYRPLDPKVLTIVNNTCYVNEGGIGYIPYNSNYSFTYLSYSPTGYDFTVHHAAISCNLPPAPPPPLLV